MTSPKDPGTFHGFEGRVEHGWIDANRHMNVAWYDYVFDTAETALFDAFGINETYIIAKGLGMFRLEKRIQYERELVEGDRLRVDSRILSTDERLVRHFHELFNITSGYRAATAEYVSIHVDLSKRKSAHIADDTVLKPLRDLAERHAALPLPRRK